MGLSIFLFHFETILDFIMDFISENSGISLINLDLLCVKIEFFSEIAIVLQSSKKHFNYSLI